jgi:hypothetical protein
MQLKRIAIAVALVAGTLAVAVPATASEDGVDTIVRTKMNGAQETAPGDTNGKGEFSAVLSGNSICYAFYAKKIAAPTAAHIHEGPPGVAGPVVQALILPTEDGVSACVQPAAALLAAIKANPSNYYVNVHNSVFPGGAIRGQLK